MGLKTICAYLGHRAVYAFRATGRIMNLFFATCAALSKATPRRSCARWQAWADSLPIVSMTSMCTGMVLSVQTAKEFVRFGAADSVGGIVAIAMAASWHLSLPVLLWPAGSEPPLLLKSVP